MAKARRLAPLACVLVLAGCGGSSAPEPPHGGAVLRFALPLLPSTLDPAKAADLRTVVHDAYASARVSPPWWRLVGVPFDKVEGEGPFQIEAVADDPEHVTKGELKLMLQTLLEDRFKARVHLESREVDGYALTIAKSGIKFKETSGDATAGGGAPAADGDP